MHTPTERTTDIDWSDIDPTPQAPAPRKPRADNPRVRGGTGFAKGAKDANRRKPRPPGHYRRGPLQAIDASTGRIQIELAQLMIARGVVSHGFNLEGYPNMAALVRGAGISMATAYNLLRRPETVNALQFHTIARICEFLRCQPADWIRYVPLSVGNPSGERQRG